MKNHVYILLFLVFSFGKTTLAQVDSTAIDTLKPQKISIIGVGDIMLGTNFPSVSYLPPNNDCYPLLKGVVDTLKNADLTIGNLEGCFSDTAPLVKRCKDSTKCYAFRMPLHFAPCLKNAGFDVLTIANNHSGDFGDLGRQTTVDVLDSMEIIHAGWEKYPYTTFFKDSIKYGIAAFAPNKGTVSIIDTSNARKIVEELEKTCDIVIVTFHGGAEGSKHQRVTRKTEQFYGENRGNVYAFSHHLIDAGADVVFGHGPHVSRAVEIYKNRFIAYSLGNFCTYGRFNLRGPNGIAPIAKINVNNQGVFIDGRIISAQQKGRGVTSIDPLKRASKLIMELTKADFPEAKYTITQDGHIYLNP